MLCIFKVNTHRSTMTTITLCDLSAEYRVVPKVNEMIIYNRTRGYIRKYYT
jgi:hypothetical protein